MERYTSKICPVCGIEFKCFNKGVEKCWCENYKLTDDKLKELANTYCGCLCEKCLALKADEKK